MFGITVGIVSNREPELDDRSLCYAEVMLIRNQLYKVPSTFDGLGICRATWMNPSVIRGVAAFDTFVT